MFSGIIEAQAKVLAVLQRDRAYQLILERPSFFNDMELGHSVAVNGVCLTVEELSEKSFRVTAGSETLRVTLWKSEELKGSPVNMERSLRLGDRLHGHWVLGHVDTLASLGLKETLGETVRMVFLLPERYSPLIWSKGSVAINGVSLTINDCSSFGEVLEPWVGGVNESGKVSFSVTLVPETLKRTNLGLLSLGSKVNIELDMLAKGLMRSASLVQIEDFAGSFES